MVERIHKADIFSLAILMFFLWLIIKTGSSIQIGQNVAISSTVGSTSSSGLGSFLSNLGYNLVAPIIGSVLQDLIMIGLVVAALVASEKLATEGSKVAQQAVGSVKNAVQGYAAKQGKKSLRWAGNKTGFNKKVEQARSGELGANIKGKRLFGIPGTGGLGTAAGVVLSTPPAKRVASVLGRAIQPNLSNKDIAEAAKKNVPESPEEIKQNLKSNMNFEDTLAHLSKLSEKGFLDESVMVNGQKVGDFLDKNRADIARYGQGKLLMESKGQTGGDANSRAGEREIAEHGDDATVKVAEDIKNDFGEIIYKQGESVKALDLIGASLQKMFQGMKKGDGSKLNANALFGPNVDKKAMKRRLAAIGLYAPQILPNLLRETRSPALRNIDANYKSSIDAAVGPELDRLKRERSIIETKMEKLEDDDTISEEEREKKDAQLKSMKTDLDTLIAKLPEMEGDAKTQFNQSLRANVKATAHEDEGGGHAPGGGGKPEPAH